MKNPFFALFRAKDKPRDAVGAATIRTPSKIPRRCVKAG